MCRKIFFLYMSLARDSGFVIDSQSDSSSSISSEPAVSDSQVTITMSEASTIASANPQNINLPPNVGPLGIDGQSTNLALKWSNWITQFKFNIVAAGLEEQSDRRKVALLLLLIGAQGMVIFHSFYVDSDTVKYVDLVDKFHSHFTPKKNVTVERNRFLTRRQGQNESIDDFVTDLRNLSLSCELGTLKDDLIKDVLICGLNKANFRMKERLLQEDDLRLDRAVAICKSLELTHQQAQSIQGQESEESVYTLSYRKEPTSSYNQSINSGNNRNWSTSGHDRPNQSLSRQRSPSPSSYRRRYAQSSSLSTSSQKCGRCGQVHRVKCPAIGVKCLRCGLMNHFKQMCRSKLVNFVDEHYADYENSESESENKSKHNYFVCHVESDRQDENDEAWYVDISINGQIVKATLDTGAQVNCIALRQIEILNLVNLISGSPLKKLTAYGGISLPNSGQCTLPCTIKGRIYYISFNVIDKNVPTILGFQACKQLGLVKRIYAMNNCHEKTSTEYIWVKKEYKSVFEGLGCLPTSCKLTLIPNAQPVIDPPRRLPFKLYNRVQEELKRMECDQVIAKVTEPTEWVSSMVVTERKSGALRICMDPRNLNASLMRSHYQLPTLDVIRSQLNESCIFSTLDASSGFWNVPMEHESSKLLTFNTPFGRYRFLRLPFGISVAPEVFHRIMTECFGDILGVCVFLDDLLVHASNKNDQDNILKSVLERAKQLNIKFNSAKCFFGLSQVKYMGHIFSKDGMQVDPSRIQAICAMPAPTDKKSLQRFLGLVTYLASFIPNFSEVTANLRSLLKKDSQWQWDESHQKSFENLKLIITQAPVLAHFDVKSPIVLSVDASKFAVGAVILQNNKPIEYASKTLNLCQQGYAQIEKELYAVVVGCNKFRQYISGQSITEESDHSPLVTICKRNSVNVPSRL